MPEDTPARKYCHRCSTDKPVAEFGRCRTAKDGLQSCCKACKREQCRQWHARNREYRKSYNAARAEQQSEYSREWYARNADSLNAHRRSKYNANLDSERRRTRRYHARNRAAVNARRKAWRAANRDIVSARAATRRIANPEYIKQWRRENRAKVRNYWHVRRAHKLAAEPVQFSDAQLVQRMAMFSGCWICGGPAEHIDHVKPLSKGGMHVLANLRPACATCNTRKGACWPLTAADLLRISTRSPA